MIAECAVRFMVLVWLWFSSCWAHWLGCSGGLGEGVLPRSSQREQGESSTVEAIENRRWCGGGLWKSVGLMHSRFWPDQLCPCWEFGLQRERIGKMGHGQSWFWNQDFQRRVRIGDGLPRWMGGCVCWGTGGVVPSHGGGIFLLWNCLDVQQEADLVLLLLFSAVLSLPPTTFLGDWQDINFPKDKNRQESQPSA